MREILFRAKRLSDGVWVEGDLSRCVVVGETHIRRIEENLSTTTHKVDHETVCQYTGLTDKNGKKIFEGDCIGHPLNDVVYVNDGFYVGGEMPLYNCARVWEVVGNIFDKP